MRAHIRSVPTKETYYKKLGETLDSLKGLDGISIPEEVINKLSSTMQSDDYYEKMKEALGHGDTREIRKESRNMGGDVNTPGSADDGDSSDV